MGKGSGRLHDRTQISSEEFEDRWENTFKNRGGIADGDKGGSDDQGDAARGVGVAHRGGDQLGAHPHGGA